MIGMSAVGEFAVAMLGGDSVVYEPVSKIGGGTTHPDAGTPAFVVDTFQSILWDDDTPILWDDDTVIHWDV